MTGKTHLAVSAATVSVLLIFAKAPIQHSDAPDANGVHATSPFIAYSVLLLIGLVAGLFPDLDAPNSELQTLPARASLRLARYVRMPGRKRSLWSAAAGASLVLVAHPISLLLLGTGALVRSFTHHRGFTHTLWCALITAVLAMLIALPITGTSNPQQSVVVGAVWLAGYASHLAADACTPSGIPLPGNRKRRSQRRIRSISASPLSKKERPDRCTVPHRAETFHLLPAKMRVTTGTFADRVLVRYAAWSIFMVAAATLITGNN